MGTLNRDRIGATRWLLLAALMASAVVAGAIATGARGDRAVSVFRIETADPAVLAFLSDEGGRPVHAARRFSLVLATPEEERLAAFEALSPRRIGAWRDDRPLFVVHLPAAAGPVPALEEFGQVLHSDGVQAVVQTDAGGAESLPMHYRVERVFARTLRYSAGLLRGAREASRPRAAAHDPAIQAMVDQVDIPGMQAKVQALVNFGTRRSNTSGGVAAQNWIVSQFEALGYGDVSTFNYNSWSDNVVAVKPGVATPERIYVIGGHYDSISNVSGNAPGADDNASGTVGVLEAARVLAPHAFQSTLYFIAWSGEEEGLVGSEAWCQWAVQEGLDIRGYINLDMEGYLAGPKDLDILSNGGSTWLRDLVFETVPLYIPSLPLVDGYLTGGSSDHASFWSAGFPALFFFEDSDNYSPYIHTVNDVVGTSLNNYTFMKENVQAAVAVMATLAEPFTIAITHEPLEDTEVTGQPYPVVARIVGAAQLIPDSLRVHWRIDGGGFASAVLSPTGQPDLYAASIPGQPAGAQVEYYLRARDGAGHVKTDPAGAPAALHEFRTGVEVVFADDAETERGWTYGVPGDNATTGLWLRADPVGTDYQPENDHTPDPGHLCFVTGNGAPGGSAGEQDVDNGRTTLLSPLFDLSGASWAKLSYWRWYVDATSIDDDFWVYISNDGGGTWQLLEQVPESAYPWTQAVFADLGGQIALTAQMRLKFVAEDAGSASLVEAAIDDLVVSGVFVAPAAVPPAAPAVARILLARPNPASRGTRLEFELPGAAAVSLTLHDLAGRTVRTLCRQEPHAAGRHAAAWDGLDQAGRPVASGVYLARLQAGEAKSETRITILR